MNKKIILTGLLILFLLSCGCAEKKQTTADETIETPAVDELDDTTEETPSENDTPAVEETTEEPVSNDSVDVGIVSQEELDKLKAELEDMEFDDVGGLSD